MALSTYVKNSKLNYIRETSKITGFKIKTLTTKYYGDHWENCYKSNKAVFLARPRGSLPLFCQDSQQHRYV